MLLESSGSGLGDPDRGSRIEIVESMLQLFGLVQSLQTGGLPDDVKNGKCREQSVRLQREQIPPAGGENFRSHCSHWNAVMNSVTVANHHLQACLKPASWLNEEIR